MFLLSGALAAGHAVFEVLVFEPHMQNTARELALSGTIDSRLLDPDSRLLGHWKSTDGPSADYYFGKNGAFTAVRAGTTIVGQWAVAERNKAEDSVMISVRFADRPMEMRKILFGTQQRAAMIFQEEGEEVGKVLRYVDLEEDP